MRQCPHWRHQPGSNRGGICDLGLFGGSPSYDTCAKACELATPEIIEWALDQKAKRSKEKPLPTGLGVARSFVSAMTEWKRAGFPTVSRKVYSDRLRVCESCEHWNGTSRFGFGRCAKCKCTRLKHWVATEKCPMDKWSC